MEPIVVSDRVRVPAEAIEVRAVRAGGPGGQNVNKVASKVELRVDLAAILGLDDDAADRLRHALRNRLDAEGRWVVTSDRTRDQGRNLEDARAKVKAAVAAALVAPVPRRRTRPTRASQARRIDEKKREGQKKKDRRGGWE